MMGIITEDVNKVTSSMIDSMGIDVAINFLGGYDEFERVGGVDYLLNKADKLLKDYTNLIITDDYEDDSNDSWKSVAYGEGNDDYRIKPGYVYFNWTKNPKDEPMAHLYVDKALSDHLIPLDMPDEITEIILERWVKKYYDIPPIDRVTFGDIIGYGNDDEPKPMRTDIVSTPIVPWDDDEEMSEEMSDEEIIKLLKDTAKKYPKEDYDNLFYWMGDIFSNVESNFEDNDIEYDDLRKDYDYVLMDIWGPDDEFLPYREMEHNLR